MMRVLSVSETQISETCVSELLSSKALILTMPLILAVALTP